MIVYFQYGGEFGYIKLILPEDDRVVVCDAMHFGGRNQCLGAGYYLNIYGRNEALVHV
jgi:hypothetical protein